MADKKDSKPSSPELGAFEWVFIIAFILGLLKLISSWFNNNGNTWKPIWNSMIISLVNLFARYVVFSFFLSIVLLILVVIYYNKEQAIRKKLMSRVILDVEKNTKESGVAIIENPKWKLVQEHINSSDSSKWKLAILEADIILDDLLDDLHLKGESIGEKLKAVGEGDFEHIEEVWEAHKIRNAIAHQGSEFLLTQREAKRVIKLYESAFEEFEII